MIVIVRRPGLNSPRMKRCGPKKKAHLRDGRIASGCAFASSQKDGRGCARSSRVGARANVRHVVEREHDAKGGPVLLSQQPCANTRGDTHDTSHQRAAREARANERSLVRCGAHMV